MILQYSRASDIRKPLGIIILPMMILVRGSGLNIGIWRTFSFIASASLKATNNFSGRFTFLVVRNRVLCIEKQCNNKTKLIQFRILSFIFHVTLGTKGFTFCCLLRWSSQAGLPPISNHKPAKAVWTSTAFKWHSFHRAKPRSLKTACLERKVFPAGPQQRERERERDKGNRKHRSVHYKWGSIQPTYDDVPIVVETNVPPTLLHKLWRKVVQWCQVCARNI